MSLQPKWSLPLSKLDNQKRANTRAVLPEVTNPVRPTNFFRVDPKKIAGTAKLVLNVSDLLNKIPKLPKHRAGQTLCLELKWVHTNEVRIHAKR